MQKKKLPIGIQSFREIREGDYYYVDKTPFIVQLYDQGKHYFLSRPRRFGKSLLIDTLKALFEGQQALFKDLYAEKNWDWSVQYPVLRLSFGAGVVKSEQALEALMHEQILAYEEEHELPAAFPDISSRFKRLIRNLHTKTGQRVVVLVDEYDKPILDNLQNPEMARLLRDMLRNLYAILKDSDADLKFVFLTGVSKFSKVSLFSGLNNLHDITVYPPYSAICGYTEHDLDTTFGPELPGLDREQLRHWYNGYNWRGEAVYNPFDLLLLFREREFRSFWFETGTPGFLVDFLARQPWFTPQLTALHTSEALLSRFDVDQMAPEALLWQTGYLTFHKVEEVRPGRRQYTLGYPNLEVEAALNEALLPAYGTEPQAATVARSQTELALLNHDLNALQASFQALFASIPADWYRKSPLAQYEGYYASVFYSQLAALGLDVQGEDVTNKGRIDLSLRLKNHVYLFEFKVIEQTPEGKALQQLIDKGYAEKYRQPGVSITLIGVEFSKAERNIVGWDVQQLPTAAL